MFMMMIENKKIKDKKPPLLFFKNPDEKHVYFYLALYGAYNVILMLYD